MHQMKDRVSFSRVDYSGRLGVASVVDSMQDCCMFHSEAVGRGSRALLEMDRAWLVSSWHIIFDKRPILGEEIITNTWPYAFKGIFGSRSFTLEDTQGTVMCKADSQWFFADVISGKPVRVAQEELDAYVIEHERLDMPKVSRKVIAPDNLEFQRSMVAKQKHSDPNGHVNNGQYIHIAVEELPDNYEVSELRAEYRLASHKGDVLSIYTATVDDCFYVVITDDDKNPYFLCEFKSAQ